MKTKRKTYQRRIPPATGHASPLLSKGCVHRVKTKYRRADKHRGENDE